MINVDGNKTKLYHYTTPESETPFKVNHILKHLIYMYDYLKSVNAADWFQCYRLIS